MHVFHVCMHVHHRYTWCPQSQEESIKSPGTREYEHLGAHVWVLVIEPASSARAVSALNYCATSLAQVVQYHTMGSGALCFHGTAAFSLLIILSLIVKISYICTMPSQIMILFAEFTFGIWTLAIQSPRLTKQKYLSLLGQ